MGVAVEQSGQDRAVTDIDLEISVEPAPEPDDPAVLDRDVGGGRGAAPAVEDAAARPHRPWHGPPSRLGAPFPAGSDVSSLAAGPGATPARDQAVLAPRPARRGGP